MSAEEASLFLCERLHARISVPACGARWRGANSADGPPDLRHSVCRDCPIGKGNVVHAAALRANPRRPPTHVGAATNPERQERTTMATYEKRDCKTCGKPFAPGGPRQLYCGDCGRPTGSKPSKASKPDRVPRAIRKSASEAPPPSRTNGTRRLAELRQLRDYLANALEGVDTVLGFLSGERG